MGWLRKLGTRLRSAITRKSFSEPSFWELERFRTALGLSSTPGQERIENDLAGYAEGAYKRSGVVFACALVRQLIFSEARFLWQRMNDGKPGDMFGTQELSLLENPWPGGTTGELLSRMDLDVTVAGNFFATVVDDQGRAGAAATGSGRRISVLRPDWVTIVIESVSGDPYAVDAQVVGYMYEPQLSAVHGPRTEPLLLRPSEVCHYSPYPDPIARFRGMSWLTPVLREISADKAATAHKLKFFENGATLNTIARLPKEIGPEAFRKFVELFKSQHEGVENAYRTLFLGGGADLTVVSADLKQLDFKATQGAGETRIAADSGIHPVIVGLSEGLAGSSLNQGNFNAARRLTADKFLRPSWRMASASLKTLVTSPGDDVRLWYDETDIAFLREDVKERAQIQNIRAMTVDAYIRAGFEPNAAVEAAAAEDPTLLLGQHTGLVSVQMQPLSLNGGSQPQLIASTTSQEGA